MKKRGFLFLWIVLTIAFITGLDWLSVALFNYEFVYAILGDNVAIYRIIHIIFGLNILYLVYLMYKNT